MKTLQSTMIKGSPNGWFMNGLDLLILFTPLPLKNRRTRSRPDITRVEAAAAAAADAGR
ncbi:hypothetical protein QJS04_geneDACA002922 [Acorus gramineus]|uniref:Uncharacterized protein n=1 Tax=Acorus gramineus TaxID=55184 RepID=A0AAV9BTX4_ACOGR|nr:hypothetical protein QJS04_geneDACA002922 [Acorus gramineus]